MDLIYMTDASSYHTIRSPHYMLYEDKKFKENDYKKKAPCGPSPHAHSKKPSSEHNCKICKEKQRRQLFNLIKSRTQKTSITEEEETDEVTENKNVCVKL